MFANERMVQKLLVSIESNQMRFILQKKKSMLNHFLQCGMGLNCLSVRLVEFDHRIFFLQNPYW
jgi:hypothetical protein